ncbi:MAG TPA: hypothetical protein VLF67_03860 [Candidatus Saccharimonas sp.]|nr:hypothetical protein [Candidatus Saccharimonas sp.]
MDSAEFDARLEQVRWKQQRMDEYEAAAPGWYLRMAGLTAVISLVIIVTGRAFLGQPLAAVLLGGLALAGSFWASRRLIREAGPEASAYLGLSRLRIMNWAFAVIVAVIVWL